jgi:hypothetical protein
MKKIALMLAAALVVSAPLVAATSSLTYAATKAKSKKAPAAAKTAPAQEDPMVANTAFLRAVGDALNSLSAAPAAPEPVKVKKRKKG